MTQYPRASPQRAFERIATALEACTGPGRNGSWRCPAHEDSSPSLSVTETDDKVLVHCHAGCATEAVLAALDLTLADLHDRRPEKNNGRAIVSTYDYTDEAGELLFQVVRYTPKTFVQRRPDGAGEWIWKLGNVRRVLYRLPELIEAKALGIPIFVTEGEKDADALVRAGQAATTNPAGAGKWRAEYVDLLEGAAEVIVVADRDEPGRKHAEEVRQSLVGKVGSLHVVEPAVGKDAADHLAAGRTVDDFDVVTTGDAVDGGELLDDVSTVLARYVAFPSTAARVAVVLWVAHTHMLESFDSTPRLSVQSPEKGSGKTRLLELLVELCRKARHTSSLTAAALFRLVDQERPTLLFDEVDTLFGPAAQAHEELRGLLNAGHRKGALAYRCVGEPSKMKVQGFEAYAAVALAGIGDLPDTIQDRSIIVRMRRRAPDEQVEPFRHGQATPALLAIHDRLEEWGSRAAPEVADHIPEMPDGITDRPADVWEPLLAIADIVGGEWPAKARSACVQLCKEGRVADVSLGVRLLQDIQSVFDTLKMDRLRSVDLAGYLAGIEEAPWGDLRGKALEASSLAKRLKRYDVGPKNIRLGDGSQAKGYERADFADAWRRYLASSAEESSQSSQPSPATNQSSHVAGTSQDPLPLTSTVTDGTAGTAAEETASHCAGSEASRTVPLVSATVPKGPPTWH
jgi:hypothetical protein